jgi:hypothetical protein
MQVAQGHEHVNRLPGLTDVQTQWRSSISCAALQPRGLPIVHLERRTIEGQASTLPASAVDGGLPHCRRNNSVGFG